MAKPKKPSLDELRWYTSENARESHVKDEVDAVIVKDCQHPFISHPCWPRFRTTAPLHGRPDLCTQRYFTLQPRTRECGTGKINSASDIFGALAVCDENRMELFELVNILQWRTITQNDLVLLNRDECCHNLGFRSVTAYAKSCDAAINCFKQALHLPVAVFQKHTIVDVDVRTNLNPWVDLARLDLESSR